MKDWVAELQRNLAIDSFILAIVSTKIDLEDNRVVSRGRVAEYASRVNALSFETSAKDNIGRSNNLYCTIIYCISHSISNICWRAGVDEVFKKISEETVLLKRKGIDIDSSASVDIKGATPKRGCC